MAGNWIIWIISIAIILHFILFIVVNSYYPKWRKRKYLVPGFIYLIGSIMLTIGILILMNITILIVGVIMLVIAVIGSIVGLIVDFFTRHHKTTSAYR